MTAVDQPSSTAEGPVDRAFRLLQAVIAAQSPIGVRELGRRTGLPRSTASRLVAKLEQLRMVERTPAGGVLPGPALATLQVDSNTAPLLRDRMHPLLVDLVGEFGENAALAIEDGDSMLYLANVASENPVSVADINGERHPVHLVAPGLVVMAAWQTPRLEAYLAGPPQSATPFSMVKPTPLKRRMKQVREDGFAWTNQELDLGINGLAVPVAVEGEPTATISLYGPSYRFSPEERPQLARQLVSMIDERLSH